MRKDVEFFFKAGQPAPEILREFMESGLCDGTEVKCYWAGALLGLLNEKAKRFNFTSAIKVPFNLSRQFENYLIAIGIEPIRKTGRIGRRKNVIGSI